VKNPFRGAGYANVAATLALVVALGGTSYAAATIGTSDIKKNAVTSAKIKNKNVKTVDLKNNAVKSSKIKNGAVKAHDVADIQMQDLTLINGWSPWNANRGAKYGKSADGVVHLSGGVQQTGAFNGIITILPPGYRPTGDHAWISTNLFGGTGPARIVVLTDGRVQVQPTAPATNANAQGFTSLDGVSFIP
jgi:hypothetical protein